MSPRREFADHESRRDPADFHRGGRSRSARAVVPEDQAEAGPVTRGKIKNLNQDRGFGFIVAEGKDYFFHRSETGGQYDSLCVGDLVEFRPMASSKGPRAHQVSYVVPD